MLEFAGDVQPGSRLARQSRFAPNLDGLIVSLPRAQFWEEGKGDRLGRARRVWHNAPAQMPPDPRKSIPAPAAYLRVIARQFGTTPERRAQLFAGSGLDPGALADPGAQATLFSFLVVADNLRRMEGEEWPFDALDAFENAMQGALEVVMRSAPSVGEGFEVVARYGRVRGPQYLFRTSRIRSGITMHVAPAAAMHESVWRSLYIGALLSLFSMLRIVLQDECAAARIDFRCPSPRYVWRLRDALPGALRFNRPEDAIQLPAPLAARPSPFADPSLYATALGELERLDRTISSEDALTLRVAHLLRAHEGRLSADQTAELLAFSRRTLVRRLGEAGTSFRELLDQALRERAEAMLADGRLSRDEMSEALGFRDPTSFSRARRRWFRSA